ncbi:MULTISPECIES: N-6 DNA methylase [unclassified Pseudomonas]|uniref:N-6 DNA methylase n=1 Tax=unclassified Pseudomonas TaxID=196821 RepID=UPI001CC02338|nr:MULTISPECIES: N-6 DNA methylase [unclassified Pseudomonas]
MTANLQQEFIRVVSPSIERLRSRLSGSELVEQIVLLMVLRFYFLDYNFSKSVPLLSGRENFDRWLMVTVEKSGRDSSSFKKYFVSVCLKSIASMRTDARLQADLYELWQGLSHLPFEGGDGQVALGECFELLLFIFAENSIDSAGYSYTPRGVVHLVTEMLKAQESESMYDPVCGSAGFLIAAARRVSEDSSGGQLNLYGQDISSASLFIAKSNMLLHGLDEKSIELSNSMFSVHDGKGKFGRFDVVTANPPFSLRWDGNASDVFFEYGIPPRSNADYAFLQRALFSLKENGRAAVIVPTGVLSREGVEKAIRVKFLANHHVETVVAVPPNTFYGTAVPANILVLRRTRKESDVLFVDASSFFSKDRNRNVILGEAVSKVVALCDARSDDEDFSKLVSLADIENNDWNLSVSKYLVREVLDDVNPLETLVERQVDLERQLADLQNEMTRLILTLKKKT